MEPERAKELLRALHACRDGGCQEECDAACEMLESDPELQAWFEEEMGGMSKMDRAVSQKLIDCCGPEEGKARCIAARVTHLWKFFGALAAAAALFAVGFFVFQQPGGSTGGTGGGALADWVPWEITPTGSGIEALITDMVAVVEGLGARSLHRRSGEFSELQTWLAANDAPSGALKPCVVCKEGVGCAVIRWGDQKVSMICFRDPGCGGAGKVHAFVVDRSLFSDEEIAALERAKVQQRSRLETGGWADEEKVYLLVGDEPEVALGTLL